MDTKESEYDVFKLSLEQLIAWGFQVMISSHVKQGEPFYSIDGDPVIVFHPCDYHYFAHPDNWQLAHELNMAWIVERAVKKYTQAEFHLGRMVEKMAIRDLHQENEEMFKREIYQFRDPTLAVEGPDGVTFVYEGDN